MRLMSFIVLALIFGIFFFVSLGDLATAKAIFAGTQSYSQLSSQIVLALLLATLTMGFFATTDRFNNCAQRWLESSGVFFEKNKSTFLHFPFIFVISILLYFTVLDTFTLSIDDEWFATMPTKEVWARQGRWTNYFLQTYVIPQAVVPYLPHLLFCLSASLSYFFVLSTHYGKINFYTYALFPIFCAFPTWMMIGEFYSNIPGIALGLLLSSISIYIFKKFILDSIMNDEKISFKKFFSVMTPLSILIAIAIGGYQSFTFLFLCMGLGIIILKCLAQNINFPQVIKGLLALAVLLLLSLIVYYIAFKFSLYALDEQVRYLDRFYEPEVFFNTPLRVILQILERSAKVYFGVSYVYGVSLGAIGMLMLLGIYVFVMEKALPKRIGFKIFMISMMVAMIYIPFSLDLLSGQDLPLRTYVAIPYVLWFCAFFSVMYSKPLIRSVSMLLLVVGTFQILYAYSVYAAGRETLRIHDQLLAQSIYQRIIEIHPDFDRNKMYRVAVCGAKPMQSIYPSALSSATTVSFFAASGGLSRRVVPYMKMIGFDNVAIVPAKKTDKIKKYFVNMPIWPNAGSVTVLNNMTLIKFGNECLEN